MTAFLFFLSLIIMAYAYIAYPLLLFILASIVQMGRDLRFIFWGAERRREVDPVNLPLISIVVAAYNEQDVIEERILNCLALNYPKGRMEIVIASDASTDRTNEIVSGYADQGVRLLSFTERGGKASVLNKTIPQVKGDIAIFSDANTMFDRDAAIKLARHFMDPKIGGVCGVLRLKPFGKGTEDEGSYWQFENVLKFLENRIGATLGANGGIYAIRKNAFVPIPLDTVIMDDFFIFLKVRENGFRTIFDPNAVAYENTAPDIKGEYKRRIRIGAANFHVIGMVRGFLNPLRGAVAFAFWSHKILRWCAPFFLVVLFFSNLMLIGSQRLYFLLFIFQVVGYIMALIGYYVKNYNSRNILYKIPRFAFYFVSMNIAMLHGFLRFLKKNQKAAWERTER